MENSGLLWHCDIRNAKLTDYGCKAVHLLSANNLAKLKDHNTKKTAHGYVGLQDRSCAACKGVKHRFEQGFTKPPEQWDRPIVPGVMGIAALKAKFVQLKSTIQVEITCSRPGCTNKFIKKNGRHLFCSEKCTRYDTYEVRVKRVRKTPRKSRKRDAKKGDSAQSSGC